ncbi:MAG: CCA tRNA nucleotidyltransferase [Acidobacteria bacterium]|nr:CCA tRNA nucleotidyltransferase [Acidobacteriota bacterium]
MRAAGHQAWLVGGCVRDLLLGRRPKDFDVATDARPHRIAELFADSEEVGAAFGVMLVRAGGAQVEVATFRSDHEYPDGRRPVRVRFEDDPRQDALRRDFTINALYQDPVSGKVLDFAGGRGDLARRLVRAIGDPEARFQEDHLRLLRAVRFAAQLGFDIEPATFAAIERLHALILKVSAERIRDELTRILTDGAARRGFELLDQSGLLADILPEVAAMKGVEQPPEYHPEGDVWTHTLLMLDRLNQFGPDPSAPGQSRLVFALGALLHDVGKPPAFRVAERIRFDGHVEEGVLLAGRVLSRLRFSNDQIAQVQSLIANHMRFKDVPNMRESTFKRFVRLPHFADQLELHRLDCLASHGRLDNYELVQSRRARLKPEELKPPPLLTGDDLIGAGYSPGPAFGRILAAVEDAQLEGLIQTPEEALDLVRRQFGGANSPA